MTRDQLIDAKIAEAASQADPYMYDTIKVMEITSELEAMVADDD